MQEIRVQDLVPFMFVNELKTREFLGHSREGCQIGLRCVAEFGEDMVELANENGGNAVLVMDVEDVAGFVEVYSDVFCLVEDDGELFISLNDSVTEDDLRRDFLGGPVKGPGWDLTVEELGVFIDEVFEAMEGAPVEDCV